MPGLLSAGGMALMSPAAGHVASLQVSAGTHSGVLRESASVVSADLELSLGLLIDSDVMVQATAVNKSPAISWQLLWGWE